MRLKNIHIKGYKNIQDLTIDFTDKDGITLFIGNNGTGKSNIIEVISSIFAGLYTNKVHKPNFEYNILYEVRDNSVSISLSKDVYTIKVNGNEITKTAFQQKVKEFLPENVVACYSGESLRLFENYYKPYYDRYIDTIKKEDKISTLPMLYINKYSVKIALLTLFFCDWTAHSDVADFCTNTLNIKRIKSIKFYYDNKYILSWKHNAVVQMIENINSINGIGIISPDTCEYESIDELKTHLPYLDEQTFFNWMYAATMPLDKKAIKEIDIQLELNDGSIISIDELSEGEKKYLLIKTILEIISKEDSIVLFDEPDAHIHVSRKAEFKTLLLPYYHREIIITTHSPTLAMCFESSHIEGLGKDIKGHTISIGRDKAELVSQITNGLWSIHEQNAFLASNKPISLLVEGKTDKIHLQEAFKHLKQDYPNLEFDIFAMNSSEHIRETLIGLSCSEIIWNRKFIGIFDNDDAGRRDTKSGFESESIDSRIKHIKHHDGVPSKSFYAFLLPRKNEFKENMAFTIENCYSSDKFQEALKQAMLEKEGHFDGLSIDRIADDLKNKAKMILAEHAKSFDMMDFDGFKPVFDLIDKIRTL